MSERMHYGMLIEIKLPHINPADLIALREKQGASLIDQAAAGFITHCLRTPTERVVPTMILQSALKGYQLSSLDTIINGISQEWVDGFFDTVFSKNSRRPHLRSPKKRALNALTKGNRIRLHIQPTSTAQR